MGGRKKSGGGLTDAAVLRWLDAADADALARVRKACFKAGHPPDAWLDWTPAAFAVLFLVTVETGETEFDPVAALAVNNRRDGVCRVLAAMWPSVPGGGPLRQATNPHRPAPPRRPSRSSRP